MNRLIASLLSTGLTLGGAFAQVAPDKQSGELLREARAVLGGEARLAGVRTLSATGTVTRAAGNLQLSGDLTLEIELPDRMLRTDSLSADGGLTIVTEQGVNGSTLLRGSRSFNAPPGVVIRTPPRPAKGSDAEAEAVRAARADLARLAVALLLRAPATQPLDFAFGGAAEAPDGKADVLNVSGRDGNGFAARLFLDVATHRPLMLSYRGIAPKVVVQTRRVDGPRQGVAPSAPELAAPPPADVVEIQLFLDDFRPEDGILLPHHLTRSVAGEVTEEWKINGYKVNPTFKPGTFDER